MTNNSKQEKAPKDVELPKEHIDQTSDEKASASAAKFKAKSWKYGLLTFIIVLSLKALRLKNPYTCVFALII